MPQRRADADPTPATRAASARVLLGRAGTLAYERLVFLSDAIFAIAITLLVLNFKAPPANLSNAGLAHTLSNEAGTLFSYLLTIAIVGRYWIAHHQMFQYIHGFDVPLAMLNFAFMGSIAFLPYPTSVLGEYGNTTSVIFYAAANAVVGLAELAEWTYAWRLHHPRIEPVPDDVGRFNALSIARVPVIFMLSIPVALASTTAAEVMWIAIPLPALAMRRRRRALAARAEDSD